MKQFRIGIIGTENSHAYAFSQYFNKPDENGNYRYPDCHVTLVYGHYPEESEKVVREYGADAVAESIEQMAANVDAVMVTARDGKFHYEFVKPFLEAGIPAFVDKPFTVDEAEAAALIALAKAKNVSLTGGSMLKFSETIRKMKEKVQAMGDGFISGSLSAPLNMENPYSGFFFYSSHLCEMTMEVFGYRPKSVYAQRHNGGSVAVIVDYGPFCVTNHYNDGAYLYAGSIFGKTEQLVREVSLDGCGEKECDAFVEMLRTGKMAHSYEELAAPVYFLNAVKESYENGRPVEIRWP